jgi:urea transport system permease protein
MGMRQLHRGEIRHREVVAKFRSLVTKGTMTKLQPVRLGQFSWRGVLWLMMLGFACPVAADGGDLGTLISQLGSEDHDTAEAAVVALSARPEPAALRALEAMRDHKLRVAPSGKILIADGTKLTDATSGASANADAASLRTPTVNNVLRRALAPAIAALQLHSKDVNVRLTAAEELSKALDEKLSPAMREALKVEKDPKVRRSLTQTLAQVDFGSTDPARRVAAISAMGDSGDVAFKAQLDALLERDSTGKYREPNAQIRAAAEQAVGTIDRKEVFTRIVRDLFYGISLGSVLLLAALGLAVTFGLMRVINMAHGEMLMLGAYSTYCAQVLFQKFLPGALDYYILLALPLSFGVCMLVGMALEKSVIRFLYGRPLETLLATWGISLILIQTVRLLFGAQNVTVANPSWLSGGYELLQGVVLPYNRLATIAFVCAVVAFVNWLLRSTSLGLQVRAITQNRAMAACMGISTARVDMLTFGLGSGIAGLGGVALSQLGNVGPELGQLYIVDSFLVVVVGGVGKIAGSVVAAAGLGTVNKLLEPFAGAVLGKIFLLVFVVLFIQRRPQGLFALKGRSAEG